MRPMKGPMGHVFSLSHRNLPWEELICRNEEAEAFQQNVKPKSGFTIVHSEGNVLEDREQTTMLRRTDSVTERGGGLMVLKDILKLRTVSLDVCEVLSKGISGQYSKLYISALREAEPPSFRPPTINEVRMLD